MPKVLLVTALLLLSVVMLPAQAVATTAPCAKFEFNITPSTVAPDGASTLSGALTNCSSAGHWYKVKFKIAGPDNYVYRYSETFWVRAGKTLSQSITEAAPDYPGKYFVTIEIVSSSGALLAGPITKSFTVE